MEQKALPTIILLTLAACSGQSHYAGVVSKSPERVNLVDSTGAAIDRLLGSMNPPLTRDSTVLVASFADLDELTVSTRLGRLIAEEGAEHLIQRGFRVPEVRLTQTLHVREGGEFMLSRELAELKQKDAGFVAEVVLTGTVTSVGGTTYVNLRLIRLKDGVALAASDLELPDYIANR